jgi:SAM-dependent methyltransferase
MTEFWESSFNDKQIMWGLEPADSAITTLDLFIKNGLNRILIPGFGYGRNAQLFIDEGFDVTGIEISQTAIDLAKKHYGDNARVFHGSVCDMPFDQELYDGIFCYALVHLLDTNERIKLINDCYSQLRLGGYMVFIAISKKDAKYGEGVEIVKNTFETPDGVRLFFYDLESVKSEFGNYGLIEAREITQPPNNKAHEIIQRFWYITCKKVN